MPVGKLVAPFARALFFAGISLLTLATYSSLNNSVVDSKGKYVPQPLVLKKSLIVYLVALNDLYYLGNFLFFAHFGVLVRLLSPEFIISDAGDLYSTMCSLIHYLMFAGY